VVCFGGLLLFLGWVVFFVFFFWVVGFFFGFFFGGFWLFLFFVVLVFSVSFLKTDFLPPPLPKWPEFTASLSVLRQ